MFFDNLHQKLVLLYKWTDYKYKTMSRYDFLAMRIDMERDIKIHQQKNKPDDFEIKWNLSSIKIKEEIVKKEINVLPENLIKSLEPSLTNMIEQTLSKMKVESRVSV